jgi:DNA-binding winged helix-turn-helix (wHTH) protein/tetratricopeptide (TPR) repeat protein
MTLSQPDVITTFGPYRIGVDGQLSLGGSAIPLSPLQRRLLQSLLDHAGEVVAKEVLLQEVWGHTGVSDVNLARAMHGLRRILGRGPLGSGVIRTIYGSGYSLDVTVRRHRPLAPSPAADAFPTCTALSHFIEGLVLVRHRDPLALPRAAEHFRRCLSEQPGFTPARLQRAATLLAQHRWGLSPASAIDDELEALLCELEASGAMEQEVRALRAEALSLLSWQPDQVEQRYGAWLPEQLTPGSALHSWAWHLMATGRSAEALALLEPGLQADIPCGWMLAGLAEVLLGRPEAALERLRQPLELDPSLAGPRLLLALVLAEAGRGGEALVELERCPPLDGPLLGLGALVFALGQGPDAARERLEEAVASPRSHLPMASLWALVALHLGDHSRAALLLEKAVVSRCGLAPLVLHWPGLAVHNDTAAVQQFRSRLQAFTDLAPSQPARTF